MTAVEGTLTWTSAHETGAKALLAPPVASAISRIPDARVAPIDPTLADTAAFCEAYGSPMEHSANCVVVAGKRAGEIRYAAVLVLATMRADINGVVRRHLDVRKISFAPQDEAVRAHRHGVRRHNPYRPARGVADPRRHCGGCRPYRGHWQRHPGKQTPGPGRRRFSSCREHSR